ncbi:MAG: hypothetical protein AB1586_13590 [Pseudomonadota bacterium]
MAALLTLAGVAAATAIGYAHLQNVGSLATAAADQTDPAQEFPTSNADTKADRLPAPPPFRLASYSLSDAPAPATPMSQYASTEPGVAPDLKLPGEMKPSVTEAAASKPKAAAATPPAKPAKPTNVILNDAQIASLKQRLKLSPSQEPYWPEIEAALRGVVKQIYEANKNARGRPVPVDTSTTEVERLKTAAMPLLMQMRADQKAEVINLARIIGMEKLVAML